LGNLFRRRGETERAIRVHQNLVQRPDLPSDQKTQAMFELGQDYLKAGLLDRAEETFNQLVSGPLKFRLAVLCSKFISAKKNGHVRSMPHTRCKKQVRVADKRDRAVLL
jgi:hypothetical protein